MFILKLKDVFIDPDMGSKKNMDLGARKFSLAVLIFLMIAYSFVFKPIYTSVGSGAFIMMNIFPVAAGLLFGLRAGFIFGFITAFYIVFLGSTIPLDLKVFMPTVTVSGVIMVALGTGVGRMRDLSISVKRELGKRLEVEEKLRESQRELELRVKERTMDLEQTTSDLHKEINEREQAEEEKEKLQAYLQQNQKMEAIANLAGGIAHQFNNALSPITVNLDMLEMDFPHDENISICVEQMRRSALRMARLTSQLLAYARGGKYQSEIISVCDFVRDTMPLIDYDLNSSVYVETDLPGNIMRVNADNTQMQMVLSAILGNASESIEVEGRIWITCRNETITENKAKDHPGFTPGHYVKLEIEDDGKGMDEETRSQIFEPFFTTKFEGRGLGMAAAYGIIKSHDGLIFVDSELDKGTKVSVYLPAVKELLKEPEKLKHKPLKGPGTILIIEDEEMVRDVSCRMLEKQNYRVLEARTGKEAITIAKTFDGNIDLAILDIVLPDMRGAGIYSLLMEARPNLKVIVCSGYAVDGPAQKILDAGAQGFIQKPYSVDIMLKKLREVLAVK